MASVLIQNNLCKIYKNKYKYSVLDLRIIKLQQ